jgi:hypothetical protein
LLYVLAAVGLVPFVASEKDRSAVGWALLALLFSPLLALVALAAVPSGTHGEPVSSFDAELRRQ